MNWFNRRHVHNFMSLELIVDPIGNRKIHLLECKCGEFAVEVSPLRIFAGGNK